MTWTVTAKGINNASFGSTVASVALTGLTGIAAGDSIISYGTYGTYGAGVPSGTDSVPNPYTVVDNANEVTNGSAYCTFMSLNIGSGPTSITLNWSPSQPGSGIGALQVHNSVAGAVTLHNHTATDITTGITNPSSTVTATSGDLVIGVMGVPFQSSASAVTMTGVTTPTIANSDNTTGLTAAYGVTTTTGLVTVQWTQPGANTCELLLLTLSPPVAGPACVRGGLSLLGIGCAIGAAKMLSAELEDSTPRTRRSLWIPRGH